MRTNIENFVINVYGARILSRGSSALLNKSSVRCDEIRKRSTKFRKSPVHKKDEKDRDFIVRLNKRFVRVRRTKESSFERKKKICSK